MSSSYLSKSSSHQPSSSSSDSILRLVSMGMSTSLSCIVSKDLKDLSCNFQFLSCLRTKWINWALDALYRWSQKVPELAVELKFNYLAAHERMSKTYRSNYSDRDESLMYLWHHSSRIAYLRAVRFHPLIDLV